MIPGMTEGQLSLFALAVNQCGDRTRPEVSGGNSRLLHGRQIQSIYLVNIEQVERNTGANDFDVLFTR